MSEENEPVEDQETQQDEQAATPPESVETESAGDDAEMEAALETEAVVEDAPETETEPEEAADEVEEPDPLSKPATIDIAAILVPIEGETPVGAYLRYDGIYDELSEARRADEDLAQGAWQEELKVADFRKVIELAVPVLTTRTKDLQIACWLCEALTAEYGFAGLRDSLKLLHKMLLKYWDAFYPEIDEGDEEGRANALAWIDREAGQIIRKAPLTVDEWGYNGFLDSKKFVIPDNLEALSSDEKLKVSALKEQAERQNRATEHQWNIAVKKTKRVFCEEVEVGIDECLVEYDKLNAAIEAKFDRNQAPSLPDIKKSLSEIQDLANKILDQKRIEEPDPSDHEDTAEDGEAGGASGQTGLSGAIRNRSDALRRLSQVAAFFKNTEPHSPVSYLVNRAVSWGSMPLETWLQDVIKDQNILAQLRQTLGFNTSSAETDEAGGSEPEEPKQEFQPLQ